MDIAVYKIPRHSMHDILQRAEDIIPSTHAMYNNPAVRIYAAIIELERGDCGFINPVVDTLTFWKQWRDTFSYTFHCQETRKPEYS